MVSPATTACEYGPPGGPANSVLTTRLAMLLSFGRDSVDRPWPGELLGEAVGVDERVGEQDAQGVLAQPQRRALGVGERDPRRRRGGRARREPPPGDVRGLVDQPLRGAP